MPPASTGVTTTQPALQWRLQCPHAPPCCPPHLRCGLRYAIR